MSTLIILRGNSGSGKSSVAKMLHKEIGKNALLISQDMVRRDMMRAKDGEDTEALPLLIALLQYGHAHCQYGRALSYLSSPASSYLVQPNPELTLASSSAINDLVRMLTS